MGLVKSLPDMSNLQDLEQVKRFITIFFTDILSQFNGRIEFDKNVSCQILDFSFTTANTNFGVSHSLGRIPQGYFLIQSNVATSLYNGTSANTISTLFLRSSAVANVKILLF